MHILHIKLTNTLKIIKFFNVKINRNFFFKLKIFLQFLYFSCQIFFQIKIYIINLKNRKMIFSCVGIGLNNYSRITY
jgi:hypothetical protein